MLDLRDKIASLSMDEKVDLLDAVWESLESDASSLSDAQRAELDRRIDQHQQPVQRDPVGASATPAL